MVSNKNLTDFDKYHQICEIFFIFLIKFDSKHCFSEFLFVFCSAHTGFFSFLFKFRYQILYHLSSALTFSLNIIPAPNVQPASCRIPRSNAFLN